MELELRVRKKLKVDKCACESNDVVARLSFVAETCATHPDKAGGEHRGPGQGKGDGARLEVSDGDRILFCAPMYRRCYDLRHLGDLISISAPSTFTVDFFGALSRLSHRDF